MTPTREAMRAERRALSPRSHGTDNPTLGTIPGHAEILAKLLRYDPTDYEHLLAPRAPMTPERALRVAVIGEAFDTLVRCYHWLYPADPATRRRTLEGHREPWVRDQYAQTRWWFLSPDRRGWFSFLTLCDVLDIEPARIVALVAALPELDTEPTAAVVDQLRPPRKMTDVLWEWACEQPGPWTARQAADALGYSERRVWDIVKHWASGESRHRRIVMVGRGRYEVVRVAEKGVG